MTTHQQRARTDLAKEGYVVEALETTMHNGFKHDGFGCFDLIALGYGQVKFVQVTSHDKLASRMRKVQAFVDGTNGTADRPIGPNLPRNWVESSDVIFQVWTYGKPQGGAVNAKTTRRRWDVRPGQPPEEIDA